MNCGFAMSVSRKALFNAAQPPRPLLSDLHGMLDSLVKPVGIVTHSPARPQVGPASSIGRLGLLAFLSKQQAGGLGHGVIEGREPAATHNGFDRTLEVGR
jgi:hypothetical protein